MVNILAVIVCILTGFGVALMLFIYFETVKERKEQQQYAMKLLDRLKVKAFLLKEDLTDFTERNNLMQADFFYDYTFNECIASIKKMESRCTDPSLIATVKTSKRATQLASIIANCRYWMLHIDRVSHSLDKKSSDPVYNKELVFAV